MAPFQATRFIDSLSDLKTGQVEKQISLLYLGLDLLDLNEELEEIRSNESIGKEGLASLKASEKESYPWWKLW